MEAPRTSLNAHLPWPQTAALLGLHPADEALPARLACPLCGRGRLHVGTGALIMVSAAVQPFGPTRDVFCKVFRRPAGQPFTQSGPNDDQGRDREKGKSTNGAVS